MQDGYVLSICNALIDVLVQVSDQEFKDLNIEKGIMHLVDHDRQKILLEKFSNHPATHELGGSAMNTTRTLAALGVPTMFFGTVGDDKHGDLIQKRMKELGIKSRVEVLGHHPTGSCAILITPDGERTMNTFLGASLHYHEEIVPYEDIKRAKILHFTGYQWSTDHQRKAVKQAIHVAKECGITISFDVADPFVVRAYRDDFIYVIEEYADIVFANAQEAKDLYGKSAEEAAEIISDQGAVAAIKLGARGALIQAPSEKHHIPAVPTNVVDTTGAGDMFAGGFLYGYMRGKKLEDCGHYAAAMAADVISHIGARISEERVLQVRSW